MRIGQQEVERVLVPQERLHRFFVAMFQNMRQVIVIRPFGNGAHECRRRSRNFEMAVHQFAQRAFEPWNCRIVR